MVSQVGLNQGLINNSYPAAAPLSNPSVTNNKNSLFDMSNPPVNNYANDFMMQNLDFNAMAAGIYPQSKQRTDSASSCTQNQPQTQTIVPNQQAQEQVIPSFSGNDNVNTSELDGCLVQRDPNLVQTENGNTYRKTYTLTKLGAAVGLGTPVAVKGF